MALLFFVCVDAFFSADANLKFLFVSDFVKITPLKFYEPNHTYSLQLCFGSGFIDQICLEREHPALKK